MTTIRRRLEALEARAPAAARPNPQPMNFDALRADMEVIKAKTAGEQARRARLPLAEQLTIAQGDEKAARKRLDDVRAKGEREPTDLSLMFAELRVRTTELKRQELERTIEAHPGKDEAK